MVAVFALIYVAWLDVSIRDRFEGRRWQVPARIYARPLEIYQGADLAPEALISELDALGYRASRRLSRPGSYHASGRVVRLRTRSFRFWDGEEPARSLRVEFSADAVRSLSEQGTAVAVTRLEPRVIGRVDPRHREDRILVRLDDLPKALVGALLSVEDRTFFDHRGVSLRGIARALLANLRAGAAVQGGSTLTQQLAKNFFLTSERTLWRKLNDVAIAVLLELRYDKIDILEAYLNEIYLGQQGARAIHGVGLAARFYFGRPVQELDVAESALIVALVRGPSVYNPRRHPRRAVERRNQVLDIMHEMGVLDAAQTRAARARPLGVLANPPDGRARHAAFVDLVRRQLARDYRAEDLRSEGLRIFTTLDPAVQAASERSVQRRLAAIEKARRREAGSLQAAVVVSEPQSAEVLALVGGRASDAEGFNRALDARRPVGSLVKPVVYLAALMSNKGYSLLSNVEDRSVDLADPHTGKVWSPRNYDGEVHGTVNLMHALARSYNLAAVNLGRDVGVERVAGLLQDLGAGRRLPAYPSLLLGAVEMSPLEVSQVYQGLAASGFHQPLRAIRAVTTAMGEPLTRYELQVEQVVPAAPVFLLNRAMMEVMRSGTGRSAARRLADAGSMAGKTGTTDDLRDSWFAGYGRNRLTVVWVGRDDNASAGLTGAGAALPIWSDVMAAASARPLAEQAPPGVQWSSVDMEQGRRFRTPCAEFPQMLPFLAAPAAQQPPEAACGATAVAATEAAGRGGTVVDSLQRWIEESQ
jgi:penicillin-binding protein 1B